MLLWGRRSGFSTRRHAWCGEHIHVIVVLDHLDPSLSALRKTGRFKILMRKLSLVDYWRAEGWPAIAARHKKGPQHIAAALERRLYRCPAGFGPALKDSRECR
jgi:hypothetical protein